MLYLANASSERVRDAMRAGLIGQMVTPAEGRRPLSGVPFAADNGAFGKGYPGDERWLAWLQGLPREGCLFAVAPDVVADASATLALADRWLPVIRALGFPAALVLQDGQEHLPVPWDLLDAVFIGGTTEWKLGPAAARLAAEARRRSKTVHMGRVNSGRRWAYAEVIGCDTADGTFLAFGPDKNLPRLRRWQTPSLFTGGNL